MSGLSRSEYIKSLVSPHAEEGQVLEEARTRSTTFNEDQTVGERLAYEDGLQDGKVLGKEELASEILALWKGN